MNALYQQLLALLDEAQELASQFTGGYSNLFLSAEEFHAALAASIELLKQGDMDQLHQLQRWFAPTGSWDDLVRTDGIELANEISELLSKMLTKMK